MCEYQRCVWNTGASGAYPGGLWAPDVTKGAQKKERLRREKRKKGKERPKEERKEGNKKGKDR